MPIAWRLVKTKFAATAFDGEGARLHGGRWNSAGVGVAYASESTSLAMLEILVHVGTMEPMPSWSRISVDIPSRLVRTHPRASLPANWKRYPSPLETAAIGDDWVKSGSSAVLKLPSVLIETEHNFLINPRHPDFAKIGIGPPEPFPFDERLTAR